MGGDFACRFPSRPGLAYTAVRHRCPEGDVAKRIHFISGLPRSGSTLLSALLMQNPRFHAGMSGPVGGFFTSLLGQMSGANEFSVFLDATQKKAILKGVFENYYAAQHHKVVFDTNRLWCSKMAALAELFPDARVIACVRETAWIVDSIESLIQRNAFEMSKIFNFDSGGTVYSRAEGVSGATGMVGFAINALKEAYFGAHTKNLMLLRYETLTQNPAEAIKALYDFVDEKFFPHDFNNVVFDADEFDTRLGTPGLHRVGRQVKCEKRETILPPDIFRRYENDNFWNNAALNTRRVRVI
jgi:sulfotransferase